MPGIEIAQWQAQWTGHHDLVQVPGDHFTMMTVQARHTASTVHDWLSGLPSAPGAGARPGAPNGEPPAEHPTRSRSS
jgi:hypothetical protein